MIRMSIGICANISFVTKYQVEYDNKGHGSLLSIYHNNIAYIYILPYSKLNLIVVGLSWGRYTKYTKQIMLSAYA